MYVLWVEDMVLRALNTYLEAIGWLSNKYLISNKLRCGKSGRILLTAASRWKNFSILLYVCVCVKAVLIVTT